MTNLKTTRGYKNKLKELRKKNRSAIPNMNFIVNDSLHTLFLQPDGDMIYLVSNNKETLGEYKVSKAYLSTNEVTGVVTTVLNSPFDNVWILMEFDSRGSSIAQFVGLDWVTFFKEKNHYSQWVEEIGLRMYDLALTK